MNKQPLVTIGITAYNASDSIERAIASARAQSWGNCEIIIVDDCSTDDTWDIIQKQDNIRMFQNETNKGVAASRNRIIAEAKGAFIAFFDDDDESATNRITQQIQRITALEQEIDTNALIFCHASRLQLYPDGTQRVETALGSDNALPPPHGKAVAARILTGKQSPNAFGSAATCSQMARTQTYRTLGGFDESFRRSEDTELNIRAALNGAYFIGTAEPLVTQTMTMASEKTLNAELEFTLKYLEKHQATIEETSNYKFCRDWIIAKYDFLAGNKAKFITKLIPLFVRHPIETAKRILWAAPNIGFNTRTKRFHKNDLDR